MAHLICHQNPSKLELDWSMSVDTRIWVRKTIENTIIYPNIRKTFERAFATLHRVNCSVHHIIHLHESILRKGNGLWTGEVCFHLGPKNTPFKSHCDGSSLGTILAGSLRKQKLFCPQHPYKQTFPWSLIHTRQQRWGWDLGVWVGVSLGGHVLASGLPGKNRKSTRE